MTETQRIATSVAARYQSQIRISKMSEEQLIKVFDSLKPKQRVKAAIKAVMGHGDAEAGKPTEYIVGRRTQGRFGERVLLLPGDGSAPHPFRKVTLHKRKGIDDNTVVVAALGDMAATLISLEIA